MTLLVVGVCLSLSWWQWQRAGEKREWLSDQAEKTNAAPVSLARALDLEDPQHRPVRVSGELDNRRSVLLDNRTWQGVAGYFLLTPLRTDQGHWVLINRGWLPRGADRAHLPEVPAVNGRVTLTGNVYQPSARTLVLKDTPLPVNQWPLRVQKVDFAAIGHRLGVELAPFEIRVAPNQSLADAAALPRPWQNIATLISPERHQAYALQWLGLAMAALIMYLIALLRGRRRHQPDA
ncbi:MAG TPA: SURF1 family protein [Alcanivorax sp.]|nr:SURF1 family protein [Alcanivorax sp.]